MNKRNTCAGCGRADCICELLEQVRGSEKRETEAIIEARQYRDLWEAAASCIQHNGANIKPRGPDERRMLARASIATCGHFWSGETDGWLVDIGSEKS